MPKTRLALLNQAFAAAPVADWGMPGDPAHQAEARRLVRTLQVSGRISIVALCDLRSDDWVAFRIGDGQAAPPALYI